MIRELRIKNIALIKELSLQFEEGFSVFTGETGAGKSILIGSIGLLLGERASTEIIRSGSTEAEVSGVFEFSAISPSTESVLDEMGISAEDMQIIIRRTISQNGRNRVFINQNPVPLSSLKRLGNHLIDLHGQHEHQSLMSEPQHIAFVDKLPGVGQIKQDYQHCYTLFVSAKEELQSAKENAKKLLEKKELLEFQFSELSKLKLQPGEESELENELSLLTSSAERISCVSEIGDLLNSGDSALKRLSQIRKKLDTLCKFDSAAQPWISDIENMISVCGDLEMFCDSYLSKTSQANPARIEFINSRLAKIQKLKKKYFCSLEELIEKRDNIANDLSQIENISFEEERLQEKLKQAEAVCKSAGEKLRHKRLEKVAGFDNGITSKMEKLGFTGGEWKTELQPLEKPGPDGLDYIRFTVKTNAGEEFLPLCKCASGGEISRLMLAIKSILSEQDEIPVLIFDEIDTGIGGVVAVEVANALYALSKTHQIFCISHLHQIASIADNHYVVNKTLHEQRTHTVVRKLSDKEKVAEISRMLGDDSEISKQHALELLKKKSKV
ncbi:DNA repair protein RecN [Chitinispirillum alkaliphilum]|nr:DNA repair protein RecN [Chitinispirillum alkaliphilum]